MLSLTAGAEEVLAGHKEVEEIRQHVSSYHLELVGLRLLHHEEIASSGAGGLFEHLRQHRKRLARRGRASTISYLPRYSTY